MNLTQQLEDSARRDEGRWGLHHEGEADEAVAQGRLIRCQQGETGSVHKMSSGAEFLFWIC